MCFPLSMRERENPYLRNLSRARPAFFLPKSVIYVEIAVGCP